MGYFYYHNVLYFSLHSFAIDYNLSYDSLRYQMRKMGKNEYLKHLNDHPEVIEVLIQRYKKKEQR